MRTRPFWLHLPRPFIAAAFPGVLQWLDGARRSAVALFCAWLAAIGGALWVLVHWEALIDSPTALWFALGVAIVWSVAAAVSAITASWDLDWRSGTVTRWITRVLAVGVAAAFVAGAGLTVRVGVAQTRVADSIFVDAPVAEPATSVVHSAGTARTTAPHRSAGRLNVLLLGGDAGPGRWMLRADSINVASVDLDTGAATLIGIPRNLYGVPVPAAMRERFPRGFDNLINAATVWGDLHPDDVRTAFGATDEPGATFLSELVAELLGIRIDAFVLVDMAGFIDLVDAVGGIDVYVAKTVPAPGNVRAAKHPLPGRFLAGWQHMDGTNALGYARSRSGDSDYQRMSRQRCVLASIAAQRSPEDLVRAWPGIAEAISRSLRTSLRAEQILQLRDLAGVDGDDVAFLSLTPPTVPQRGFDPATIRTLVDAALDAATPPVAPAVPTAVTYPPRANTTTTTIAGGVAATPATESCRVAP
jgi:LCP family protein required for cell wall assembly